MTTYALSNSEIVPTNDTQSSRPHRPTMWHLLWRLSFFREHRPHFTAWYCIHDDVIKWKHLPRYWPFVRGIHRSPVNSPHTGQWREALMFSLICVWINSWVNNREAGDLRRYHVHYDVTVMSNFIHGVARDRYVLSLLLLIMMDVNDVSTAATVATDVAAASPTINMMSRKLSSWLTGCWINNDCVL